MIKNKKSNIIVLILNEEQTYDNKKEKIKKV